MYNDATLTLANSTFSNDSAGGYGGGLYNNATATLTNSTFSGDSAGSGYYGGGLYNNNNATLCELHVQQQHGQLRRRLVQQ